MTNQEAIKRIKEHIAIHKYRESHAIHIVEALEMAISALQAQDVPDTNVGDTIYRQAAIDALSHMMDTDGFRDGWAVSRANVDCMLRSLPSTQPEIIRCKECRYYEWMSNRVPDEQTWFCHNWNAETGKDDYCSYAERREE